MKYIRRSRAVINVAKSPSRLRRTLDARAPVDDVLSSYIGIILPRAAAAAPLARALYSFLLIVLYNDYAAAAPPLQPCQVRDTCLSSLLDLAT